MNKLHKSLKLVTIALILVMLSIVPTSAFVTKNTIDLIRDKNGILVTPNDNFLCNIDPSAGSKSVGTINVFNNYSKPFTLYLGASSTSHSGDIDLLSKIILTVTNGDTVIYDGPLGDKDGLEKDIEIGYYNPGDRGVLKASITLSDSISVEECTSKFGSINLRFKTVSTTDNTKPPNPDPNDDTEDSDSSPPKEDIIDIPSIVSPDTGDTSIFIYIALILVVSIILYKRLKK